MPATEPNSTGSKIGTLALCALLGFIASFLLLDDSQGYSYGWSGQVDRFFKWLKHAHTNEHVLLLCPLAAVLLGLVVFRFIDYAKSSGNDDAGGESE